jgi:hypothetical protein
MKGREGLRWSAIAADREALAGESLHQVALGYLATVDARALQHCSTP